MDGIRMADWRLILLRHGVTEANERRLYCGASDPPLSPAGRQALAELRRTAAYPPLEGLRVYTSGLRRTEETLFAIYGVVAHETLPAFQEMHFGVFEGHSYEELKEDPAYQTWISGDNERNRCPGGESGAEMTDRVLAAFQALPVGEGALIVTHGGPIAAIMAHLFPEAGKNRYAWQPKNGCGYALSLSEDRRGLGWRALPEPRN